MFVLFFIIFHHVLYTVFFHLYIYIYKQVRQGSGGKVKTTTNQKLNLYKIRLWDGFWGCIWNNSQVPKVPAKVGLSLHSQHSKLMQIWRTNILQIQSLVLFSPTIYHHVCNFFVVSSHCVGPVVVQGAELGHTNEKTRKLCFFVDLAELCTQLKRHKWWGQG